MEEEFVVQVWDTKNYTWVDKKFTSSEEKALEEAKNHERVDCRIVKQQIIYCHKGGR